MGRQLLLGLGVVGLLALAVLKIPSCMVTHAKESARECFERLSKSQGDASSCRRDGWLALAKRLPHTRERAQELADSIDGDIRYAARRAALSPAATVADRQRAIAYASNTNRRADRSAAPRELVRFGAFAEAAAIDPVADTSTDHAPLFAALVLGDMARAKAIVQVAPLTGEHIGALACLLGARERGLSALAAAEQRELGLAAARVASVHCGGSPRTAEISLYFEALTIARAYDPAFQSGRRGRLGRWLRRSRGAEKLAGNAILLGAENLSPLEVLQTVASRDGVLDAFGATRWTILRSRTYGNGAVDYVPVAWLDAAATRVVDALAKPPPKPPTDERRFDLEIEPELANDPRATLQLAAARLYAQQAVFALRAARPAVARDAIAKLRALKPASIELAALELAAGEPALSLATIDRWAATSASPEPHVRDPFEKALPTATVALVTRVLALAATGDHAAAYAAASTTTVRDPLVDWLVLATAITSKTQLDKVKLHTSDRTGDAAAWLSAFGTRRDMSAFVPAAAEAVLPAVLVVFGHMATLEGGDPEAWLDAELLTDELPSRAMLRARAEAARWRGDTEAAKRHDARADKIESLFVDDRAVALAGIARLW